MSVGQKQQGRVNHVKTTRKGSFTYLQAYYTTTKAGKQGSCPGRKRKGYTMRNFLYNANKTMKLIGHQTLETLQDKEAQREFEELKATRQQNGDELLPLLLDMYLLGVIHGIRKERKRRKGRA